MQSPQELKDKLREVFMIFDGNADFMVTEKEFVYAIRAYGLNLSNLEFSRYLKNIEKDPRGNISFEDFSNFMLDKMDQFDSTEDIIDAFATFDMEGKGFINVEELRYILMNFGEKLSEKEMTELTKAAQPDAEGNVDYREFVRRIEK